MNRKVQIAVLAMLFAIRAGVAEENTTTIDQSSVTSLQLKMFRDKVEIGNATGFVLEKNHKYYLLTNRHVVLWCAQDQSATDVGGWLCANKLAILHNRLGHLGEWLWVDENLYDLHGNKRWVEHPTLGAAVDIIALPLEHTDNVQFYPLDLALRKTDISLAPGDSVSIIGFPFGLAQAGGLPIWKTGTIASDLDINFGGKPIFLVDTTSRPGMSGSPVYAIRTGAYRSSDGRLKMAVGGSMKKFIGVYSEQNQAAEVGGVWKADTVMQLYDSLP